MPSQQRQEHVFLYSARTQFTNAGDALINRGLVQLSRDNGRIIAIRAGADEAYLSEIGLKNADLISGGELALLFRGLRERFAGHRVVIVETPGDIGGRVSASHWVKSGLVPLLALFGIRTVRFGASLGHASPTLTWLMAWQSRFAMCVGLRDPISIGIAEVGGFRNVQPSPDLAFAVTARSPSSAPTQGIVVALCFRSDQLSEEDQVKLLEIIKNSLQLLDVLRTVIVVQVTRDQAFAERLAKAVPGPVEIFASLSIEDIFERYSQTDVLLTNRLHGYLMAGLSGALPIAIVDWDKNRKIVGLLHDIGLHGLACDLDSTIDLKSIIAGRADWMSRFRIAAGTQREKLSTLFHRALSRSQ